MEEIKNIINIIISKSNDAEFVCKLLQFIVYTFMILGAELITSIILVMLIVHRFNKTKKKASKYHNNGRKQLKIMKSLYRLKKFYQLFNLNISLFAPEMLLFILAYALIFITIFIKELINNNNASSLLPFFVTTLSIILLAQLIIYLIATIISSVGGKEKFEKDSMELIKNYLEEIKYDKFKIKELNNRLKKLKKLEKLEKSSCVRTYYPSGKIKYR